MTLRRNAFDADIGEKYETHMLFMTFAKPSPTIIV
jgi:hypothetical protein